MLTRTYLDMLFRSEFRPKLSWDPCFSVREATERNGELSQALYLNVGARWGWNDQAHWSSAQWAPYAQDESRRTFVAYYNEALAGYFELVRRPQNEIEVPYL